MCFTLNVFYFLNLLAISLFLHIFSLVQNVRKIRFKLIETDHLKNYEEKSRMSRDLEDLGQNVIS